MNLSEGRKYFFFCHRRMRISFSEVHLLEEIMMLFFMELQSLGLFLKFDLCLTVSQLIIDDKIDRVYYCLIS